MMEAVETEMPVDCLVCVSSSVVAGGYLFEDGTRTGKTYVYSQEDMSVREEFQTSGTLDIKARGDVLYLANGSDVSSVGLDSNSVCRVDTADVNTYISLGDNRVFVSDVGGSVCVYDGELRVVDSIRVSDSAVWVSEICDKELVSGSEDGGVWFIDTRTMKRYHEMRRESGITSLYRDGDYLLVGSYDEHVEVVDSRCVGVVSRTRVGGGVWRIARRGERFYMACMYEGLKVCDRSLGVLENHLAGSLVYGMSLGEDRLFFASFYDKKIHVQRIW